ncbi:MAG TPA: CYTH domain-containing protein [Bacillota bacterium]|nr:CYTH domain-containing protein [Bacillota bacterium]
MSQEIEIEFKHLLTYDQFKHIKESLPFPQTPIVQKNHYFETIDHTLIHQSCALRIRVKNDSYVATLKEPCVEGILETHDILSEAEMKAWINDYPTPTENIHKRLVERGISLKDIQYIGFLTTKRYSYSSEDLVYVLDESIYGNQVDYELEIESQSYSEGEQAYHHLKNKFQLEDKKPITKIERFLQSIHPK